jgi:glycine/D-amino acid oxidase-like deaminating enzyme
VIGSLWEETVPAAPQRPPLDGSITCDVAIVGAGYTGLWTAYHLLRAQPDREVLIVEGRSVGFGASGRNGGWATSDVSINRGRAAKRHGRQAVVDMIRAMHRTVDDIGEIASAEGIECDFAKGGTLTLATAPAQVERVKSWVDEEQSWGFGRDDYRWLEPEEVAERVRIRECHGAYYTTHCAALHPMKLVMGLAEVVERMGGRIVEGTHATEISSGRVVTDQGVIGASVVIRATEAFTALDQPRRIIPVYSLMVATEPLSEKTWEEIGLDQRETFHDGRHLVIYGQRTADGRFAFGGRGAPYHFGSAIRPEFDRHASTHQAVEIMLRDLFPQIEGAEITHRWGGPVGMPRDLQASVAFDREKGMGSASGYVGVGVAASHLAGQTLAELILGLQTERTSLPWVGHRSRSWEPEPLRWAGVNLGRMLAPAADAMEDRTGRPSRILGGMLEWLLGHE